MYPILRSVSFFALLSVIILGCAKENPNAAMEETNKAAYIKSIEAFSTGNSAIFEEVLAADFIDHDPDPMVQGTGVEHWKNQVTTYRTAFPDMKVEATHVMAKEDMVWARIQISGTNSGEMYGMPPTGKKMDVSAFELLRFKDGKAVERWGVFDAAKMMEQLGMIPGPDAMPPAGEVPAGMAP